MLNLKSRWVADNILTNKSSGLLHLINYKVVAVIPEEIGIVTTLKVVKKHLLATTKRIKARNDILCLCKWRALRICKHLRRIAINHTRVANAYLS